jgi:hypothetical protein
MKGGKRRNGACAVRGIGRVSIRGRDGVAAAALLGRFLPDFQAAARRPFLFPAGHRRLMLPEGRSENSLRMRRGAGCSERGAIAALHDQMGRTSRGHPTAPGSGRSRSREAAPDHGRPRTCHPIRHGGRQDVEDGAPAADVEPRPGLPGGVRYSARASIRGGFAGTPAATWAWEYPKGVPSPAGGVVSRRCRTKAAYG